MYQDLRPDEQQGRGNQQASSLLAVSSGTSMQQSTWLVEVAAPDGYPNNLRHKSWTNPTLLAILHP